MVDRIEKALRKLSASEWGMIKRVLADIIAGKVQGYDIKKLVGREDIFRIRKGVMRIIYRMDAQGKIFILALERRSDTTYHNF